MVALLVALPRIAFGGFGGIRSDRSCKTRAMHDIIWSSYQYFDVWHLLLVGAVERWKAVAAIDYSHDVTVDYGRRQGGAVCTYTTNPSEIAVPLSTFSFVIISVRYTIPTSTFLFSFHFEIFNLLLKGVFINFHLPVLFRSRLSP